MKAAEAVRKTPAQEHDWKVISPFWVREWQLADEHTRGNGLAGLMNLLQVACTGLAMELTSTHSNVSPRDVDDGWSIIVDFPYSVWGPTGRFIGGGWKYKLQKHILRRKWDCRYFNILLLDEFQESKSDFDAPYLSRCRSYGGSMLCATQTVHAEYGLENHHKADMLMANFYTHVYCQTDPATEEAALKKLGQRREVFVITTYQPGADVSGRGWPRSASQPISLIMFVASSMLRSA